MSCGSLSATIRAPLPVPAPYLISAGVPAIPWRASLRRMLARAKRFAELRRQRLALLECRYNQLLELDDRLLADIGISRADARAEGHRPFWRERSTVIFSGVTI